MIRLVDLVDHVFSWSFASMMFIAGGWNVDSNPPELRLPQN